MVSIAELFGMPSWPSAVHAVKNKVLIAETGDRIQFTADDAKIVGKIPVGSIFIDEGSLDEVEEVVVRDHRRLAEDGIVLPVLAINKASGKVEGQLEIITHGDLFSSTVTIR